MLGLRFDKPADKPLRILCLGAHADDIEIGCGGTILSLLNRYPEAVVHWVVFSADPERSAEAMSSALLFLETAHQKEVMVESFRDGYFPDQWSDIKQVFEQTLKSFQPDLIFTHYRQDRHQDHRTISDLTWNTFRNHLILEYEILKYDGDLGTPNVFVPIAEAVCKRKIDILMECFESQRSKHWFTQDTFQALLRIRGVESATTFAEAFYSRKVLMV